MSTFHSFSSSRTRLILGQITSLIAALVSLVFFNQGFVLMAQGQFILSPKSVVETGMGTFSATVTPLSALIDQSGLDHPFVSGTTTFDPYFAPLNSNFSKNADKTKWQSEVSFDLPLLGTLDFDLGGAYLLSKVAVYNISVKQMTVLVSQDPAGPWQNVGTFTLFDQTSFSSMRATILELKSEVSARHVRFSIESEYPAALGFRFGYVTIGEVAFRARSAAAPVPTVSIASQASGDLVVTFTGTLQSKSSIDGVFADVPGNPTQQYIIPKASLIPGAQQYFRSRN